MTLLQKWDLLASSFSTSECSSSSIFKSFIYCFILSFWYVNCSICWDWYSSSDDSCKFYLTVSLVVPWSWSSFIESIWFFTFRIFMSISFRSLSMARALSFLILSISYWCFLTPASCNSLNWSRSSVFYISCFSQFWISSSSSCLNAISLFLTSTFTTKSVLSYVKRSWWSSVIFFICAICSLVLWTRFSIYSLFLPIDFTIRAISSISEVFLNSRSAFSLSALFWSSSL